MLVQLALSASAFTTNDAGAAFAAYNKAFYVVSNGQGYFKTDTTGGRSDFWMQAEEIEMIIDAYERTGDSACRRMIDESISGFNAYYGSDSGTNWLWNIYNDDIMWMAIACARAYSVTGNTAYRDTAKFHFDAVYRRACDDTLGGGLWWTTDKRQKNACVNGPAAIAACLLFKIYNDNAYLEKAKAIYAWERNTLFDASSGLVYDNIDRKKKITPWKFTYNQGTFIGAANYLHGFTGDSGYLGDAVKAASYTKDKMCNGGILPEYNQNGDSGGFTGVFVRWMMQFVRDNNLWEDYYPWMQSNADAAWKMRRDDNLSWCKWRRETPAGTLPSWGCANSVTILQVVPVR